MAEILISIQDKPGAASDVEFRVKTCNRGDPVTWHEDGWSWSQNELTFPFWRIFRVPLTVSELETFLSEEQFGVPTIGEVRRWARQYRLDLDQSNFSGPLKTFIADDTRAVPVFTVQGADVAKMRSAIIHKGPSANQ